jgi:hypothetical protein
MSGVRCVQSVGSRVWPAAARRHVERRPIAAGVEESLRLHIGQRRSAGAEAQADDSVGRIRGEGEVSTRARPDA